MPYKIVVDRAMCIGAASCEAVAPDAFSLDAEGKSVIKRKDGTTSRDWTHSSEINDSEQNLLLAAKSCPVNAITVVEVDDEGNELKQIWPA